MIIFGHPIKDRVNELYKSCDYIDIDFNSYANV